MRTPARWLAAVTLALPAVAAAEITPANVASLTRRWAVPSGAVTGGPVLRDGRLYAGAWDARVFALDPATGAEIWTRQVGGPVSGRLLMLDDGGLCYGTIGSGEVGCLDRATGAVRWQKDVSDPLNGVVWSAPIAANGRLFVGVAGLTDNPCSRGRLLALDLATGNELWRFYTVPEKVCSTDTAVACTVDGDCPNGGTCETGVGAGVTATPAVDPTGAWVYMNTVGCYTFPSIGESDSIFKIDAATGVPTWRNRVSAPEQFGACTGDPAVDCGVEGDCAEVGGTCEDKVSLGGGYHDFGFLNGPLRIEVPDGAGTKPLLVSGSKNGTLYAFEEATGEIAWTNAVRPEPVTPGFAGFGLFNGALAHADGRIFAALYFTIPPRTCSNDDRRGCSRDDQCENGGVCPPEHEHLMAFDAATGQTLWDEEIGRSWSHVAVVNGIVYAGTRRTDDETGESSIYAHDAATGARLATLAIPAESSARVEVGPDAIYVGHGGLTGVGGIVAFSLCGNGTVDAGETCDVGPDGDACCTACQLAPAGTTCDDAEVCTGADQCDAGGACAGSVATLEQLGCTLDALEAAPCGDATLPKGLARAITRTVARVERLVTKATTLAASGKTARAERLRERAAKALEAIGTKVGRAAAARKESKRITAECRAALDALVTSRLAVLRGFPL